MDTMQEMWEGMEQDIRDYIVNNDTLTGNTLHVKGSVAMFPVLVDTMMDIMGEDVNGWAETMMLILTLDATTIDSIEVVEHIARNHTQLIGLPPEWLVSLVGGAFDVEISHIAS